VLFRSISALAADETAAIAQFDDSVKLLCDFTKDRAALERAIASYAPRYGEADFSEAFRWANARLAAEAEGRELVLVSDLQTANVNSLKPIQLDGIDLRIMRVKNERRANARIDRIAARAAGEIIEADSTAMFDDGKSVLIQPINMKLARSGANLAAQSSDAMLSAEKIGDGLAGGVVTANRADDFDADDSRFFVVRVTGESKVMIVQRRSTSADQAMFIEKAMQANAPVNSSRAMFERSDLLPETLSALSNIRAIIAPVESLSKTNTAAAREQARKGGSLILTINSETDITQAMEKLEELDERFDSLALVASTGALGLMLPATQSDSLADSQPLFDAESAPAFASVQFRAARSIHLSEAETLLKYSNNEPAAVRLGLGAGQVLVLGFDLSDKDSSLARSPVFPSFIEWLTDNIGSGERAANLTVGRTPAFLLTGGLRKLTRIYSRTGQAMSEAISDYRDALGEPGVYEAEHTRGRIVFALNTPIAESSIAQSSEQELLERITINKAEPSKANSDKAISSRKSGLWRMIAMVAFAMSLIELVSSARRRTGSRGPSSQVR